MHVRRISLIVLQVLSSASLLAQGQSDPPQFRAGVELIQLDVTVLDNKRQPVRGLTAADFTVMDNGVATPIRAFTPVELARARVRPRRCGQRTRRRTSSRISWASRTGGW